MPEPASEDLSTLAQAWLAKARGDLVSAEILASSRRAPGWAVAFHCQQCVEKCLKARLVLAGIEPPATHSFAVLAQAAVGIVLPLSPDELKRLQPFAAAERYPVLRPGEVSQGDVDLLVDLARRAVGWMEGGLAAAEKAG